jgi:hypothetical protein
VAGALKAADQGYLDDGEIRLDEQRLRLEHDPEKLVDFSDKIMRQTKA